MLKRKFIENEVAESSRTRVNSSVLPMVKLQTPEQTALECAWLMKSVDEECSVKGKRLNRVE